MTTDSGANGVTDFFRQMQIVTTYAAQGGHHPVTLCCKSVTRSVTENVTSPSYSFSKVYPIFFFLVTKLQNFCRKIGMGYGGSQGGDTCFLEKVSRADASRTSPASEQSITI